MKNIEFSEIKNKWEELFVKIKKGEIGDNIVLTIYIPFCGQKCRFCNCFIRKWDKKVIENYMFVLETQMKLYKDIFKTHTFDTLIVSGGSPSVLGKDNLIRLMDLIHTNFNITKDKYVIYEADLIFTSEEILKLLSEKGVTNMTLGVQTVNKELLNSMKRFQDEEKIINLFKLMRKYKFSINLDLIYGMPGDDLKSFKKSLEFVYGLKPDQINMYKYENSKCTELYKEGDVVFDENRADDLIEAKSIIKDFFKDKEGILTDAIESYGGCDYRISSYFKNPDNIDYNDRRQTSSVLDLGYGEKTFILGTMEYELFPTEKLDNYDEVNENEILYENIGKFHDLKYSALKYFFIRFTSYINIEKFKSIFKSDINDVLSYEINLLTKLGKIYIDDTKENLFFNFSNLDELILYQRFIYNLYLKKGEK